MKLIWSPAVTLDGNIAKADGNSDWVSQADGQHFEELIRQGGCVIVGRKTYDQYKGETFPIEGATTFVWTRNPSKVEKTKSVEYIDGNPAEVLQKLSDRGYTQAVLAGGSETNNAFVGAGLVDEIRATLYPLLFGSGMRLLSANNIDLKLELLESTDIGEGVIKNRYRVIK